MIAAIHQPHFLPWVGYVNKALRSDVFVWLHSVQYRKNYFQNRTAIRSQSGEPLWLTLPVHAHLGTLIDEVRIAEPGWAERVRKTVEQCYRRAPYFSECWPVLWDSLREGGSSLDAVNFRSFRALLDLLGASSLKVVPARAVPAISSDPTERLVEICLHLGASHYIAGRGGRKYLETERFERAGIEVVWQDFDPASIVYAQSGGGFVPNLSVIDCLFNLGPAAARELILGAWSPAEDCSHAVPAAR